MDIGGHNNEAPGGEVPADPHHSVGASHTPHQHEHVSEHAHGFTEQEEQGPNPVIRGTQYKELRKLGAVDFGGTTNPAEAETWLKRTERVFTMMHCTPEEKFDYAVSLLQDDAYDWWETIPNFNAEPPVLTWDDFLQEFRDKYMPEVYRDAKQREFLSLKQGSMSVADYEVRFIQLSHYAAPMVATERDRCRRFEEGLRYEIRSKITPGDLRNYNDLRAAAIRAEQLINERPTFFQRPKRENVSYSANTSNRPRKRPNFSSASQSVTRGGSFGFRGNRTQPTRTFHPSQSQNQTRVTCQHCGRQHLGECALVTGNCYNCNKPGHFARNCPVLVGTGQATSEQAVQKTRASGVGSSFSQ